MTPANNTKLHSKKRALIAAFSRCGNISKAAELAKVDRTRHYAWKREDPEYVKAFEEAKGEAADALEDMLHSEALVEKNVTAAIFLLKGLKPAVYRERYEHSQDPKNPLVPVETLRAFLEDPNA